MTKSAQSKKVAPVIARSPKPRTATASTPSTTTAPQRKLARATPAQKPNTNTSITSPKSKPTSSVKKAAPAAPPKTAAEPRGKIAAITALLRRAKGASIEDLMQATGWQAHSVRGAMSGSIGKKLGLNVISEKSGTVRLYRIIDQPAG